MKENILIDTTMSASSFDGIYLISGPPSIRLGPKYRIMLNLFKQGLMIHHDELAFK
jgi:hypothetical protein